MKLLRMIALCVVIVMPVSNALAQEQPQTQKQPKTVLGKAMAEAEAATKVKADADKTAATTKTTAEQTAPGDPTKVAADKAAADAKAAADKAAADKAAADAKAAATALADDLTKWGFGAGLSFLMNVSGPDRVTDASIDSNGYVRVNKRNNTSAGLMMEVHHFFTGRVDHNYGWGPFVAVQAGTSNLIEAAGAGLMFGWRNSDPTSHGSFNLGIGYAGILAAQSLGNEFVPDQKAPVDSSGKPLPIRYETHDAGGLLLMASFTF